jgi:acylphosphatase
MVVLVFTDYMERLEAIVYGRVQMVMYRDFATRKAKSLSLVGEVRNLPDGTVEVIAEGPREVLNQYIEKLRKGSLLSEVERVEVVFSGATHTYSSFSITYA